MTFTATVYWVCRYVSSQPWPRIRPHVSFLCVSLDFGRRWNSTLSTLFTFRLSLNPPMLILYHCSSVERVIEYLTLPSEPPLTIATTQSPSYAYRDDDNDNVDYAGRPLIKVENLSIKYSPDLPSVIKGISFDLMAGEKVGIVGRTGTFFDQRSLLCRIADLSFVVPR